MRRGLLLGIALLVGSALAATQFPALTGRIVDEAGLLSPQAEAELATQLAAHEKTTTNQVVVVTLKSLDGYDIADYGYQLGRHWTIGQKGKDNGVLLIVAPTERKVRIEVGYGLEGVLTDALSRDIIERAIRPSFRQENYEQGIRAGVDAILAVLSGEHPPAAPPTTAAGGSEAIYVLLVLAVVVGQFVFGLLARSKSPGARFVTAAGFGAVAGVIAWMIVGLLMFAIVLAVIVFLFMLLAGGRVGPGGAGWSSSSGGWSGGGDWGGGGGGFSGGGGSFGGGGASGDW